MNPRSRNHRNHWVVYKNILRVLVVLSFVGVILLIGCANGQREVIECPIPSEGVVLELNDMTLEAYLSGNRYRYDDLLVWIGEIERHCSAVRFTFE